MVTAHMDEVGLLVKYVDDRGYVKFQQLGGWLDQALIGQRWHILTKKGKILGVSGIKIPDLEILKIDFTPEAVTFDLE